MDMDCNFKSLAYFLKFLLIVFGEIIPYFPPVLLGQFRVKEEVLIKYMSSFDQNEANSPWHCPFKCCLASSIFIHFRLLLLPMVHQEISSIISLFLC